MGTLASCLKGNAFRLVGMPRKLSRPFQPISKLTQRMVGHCLVVRMRIKHLHSLTKRPSLGSVPQLHGRTPMLRLSLHACCCIEHSKSDSAPTLLLTRTRIIIKRSSRVPPRRAEVPYLRGTRIGRHVPYIHYHEQ